MHSVFIFSGTLVYLYISILLIMNILRYYYTKKSMRLITSKNRYLTFVYISTSIRFKIYIYSTYSCLHNTGECSATEH
jgi:hypothetical protein